MMTEKMNIRKTENRPGGKQKGVITYRYNSLIFSALAGIQTPNLLIRSEMLYSVELQAHSWQMP
jgi:hypothetical protein